jgi:hypothetical protein
MAIEIGGIKTGGVSVGIDVIRSVGIRVPMTCGRRIPDVGMKAVSANGLRTFRKEDQAGGPLYRSDLGEAASLGVSGIAGGKVAIERI